MEFYSIDDYLSILKAKKEFKYSYHITITFPKNIDINAYMMEFNEAFSNINFQYFSWLCKNHEPQNENNSHEKRDHTHMIFFSNEVISDKYIKSKYNKKTKYIHDDKYFNNVINYIHNDHHIIKNNFYHKNIVEKTHKKPSTPSKYTYEYIKEDDTIENEEWWEENEKYDKNTTIQYRSYKERNCGRLERKLKSPRKVKKNYIKTIFNFKKPINNTIVENIENKNSRNGNLVLSTLKNSRNKPKTSIIFIEILDYGSFSPTQTK